MSASGVLAAGALFAGPVQAFFAPVDRVIGMPVAFDPAEIGGFRLDSPPAGWLRGGAIANWKRSLAGEMSPVWSGAPAMAKSQARSKVDEVVEFAFAGWTRLAVALSSGTQTMNLLQTAQGAVANVSGGAAAVAEVVGDGSTATELQLGANTAVQAGDVVVVDVDYAGETGYVGSGGADSYVSSAQAIEDVNYVRRVSLNVARVLNVSDGIVTLAAPLPAGAPKAGMKLSVVKGFTDRNGGSFVPEWSALFVVDGLQGDRLLLHYPRLQPAGVAEAETVTEIATGVSRWRAAAKMRALPVVDATDGVSAVCFRSYLPAAMRQV